MLKRVPRIALSAENGEHIAEDAPLDKIAGFPIRQEFLRTARQLLKPHSQAVVADTPKERGLPLEFRLPFRTNVHLLHGTRQAELRCYADKVARQRPGQLAG